MRFLRPAGAGTLQSVAADPQYLGAQIGFFCILHSWGEFPAFANIGRTIDTSLGLSTADAATGPPPASREHFDNRAI
jgi:hypothetical protein